MMCKIVANVAILLLLLPIFGHGSPVVTCYFIFGDSLSDAGNNNNLKTEAKANYAPYGIDFPGGATGRFTNGRTFVDVLTELLGFEGYIPPFNNAEGLDISEGVNYASGAAGILPETSSHMGDRIWLDRQLQNHAMTILKLQSFIQGPIANHLNKCLYTVNIGSNDYINNYFMPQRYPTSNHYNTDQYATALIAQYTLQLKALYAAGARKVAIFGLGLLGCIPAEISRNNATNCVDEINQAVQLFNKMLVSAVDDLNAQLLGAKFTFIDIYAIQAASPLGVFITTSTCCTLRSDYQCEPSIPPCPWPIRNLFAYMDGFHPTEVVNVVAATLAYNTPDPNFVHPVDISHLASA